jgi:hypothetical protein
MSTEEIMMYLGMIVVAIFVIFMLINMASLQRRVVEGLTNKEDADITNPKSIEDTVKQYKNQAVHMEDSLLIGKYKSNYEDLIISLDDLINAQCLNIVANKELTKDVMDDLNRRMEFKRNLNTVMDYLDAK